MRELGCTLELEDEDVAAASEVPPACGAWNNYFKEDKMRQIATDIQCM